MGCHGLREYRDRFGMYCVRDALGFGTVDEVTVKGYLGEIWRYRQGILSGGS